MADYLECLLKEKHGKGVNENNQIIRSIRHLFISVLTHCAFFSRRRRRGHGVTTDQDRRGEIHRRA